MNYVRILSDHCEMNSSVSNREARRILELNYSERTFPIASANVHVSYHK